MYRRILITLLGVWSLTALLCACNGESTGQAQPAEERPVVRTMILKPEDVFIPVRYVGATEPSSTVTVEARIRGLVQRLLKDMGDRVSEGELIASIDDTDYRLAAAEAKSALKLARVRRDTALRSHERMKELLPRQAVAQQRADDVEGEALAAQAEVERVRVLLDSAEEQLAKTRVQSPLKGLVSRRFVEVGDNVEPGEPLFRLVSLSPIEIRIFVNERDYTALTAGGTVDVRVDAFPEEDLQGVVHRLAVEADPKTNTFEVEIRLPNTDGRLKAGMSAEVSFVRREMKDALLVPQNAVLYRKGKTLVFVLDPEDVAREREVVLGSPYEDWIRIVSGLRSDERLIIEGQHYLKDGSRPRLQTDS